MHFCVFGKYIAVVGRPFPLKSWMHLMSVSVEVHVHSWTISVFFFVCAFDRFTHGVPVPTEVRKGSLREDGLR